MTVSTAIARRGVIGLRVSCSEAALSLSRGMILRSTRACRSHAARSPGRLHSSSLNGREGACGAGGRRCWAHSQGPMPRRSSLVPASRCVAACVPAAKAGVTTSGRARDGIPARSTWPPGELPELGHDVQRPPFDSEDRSAVFGERRLERRVRALTQPGDEVRSRLARLPSRYSQGECEHIAIEAEGQGHRAVARPEDTMRVLALDQEILSASIDRTRLALPQAAESQRALIAPTARNPVNAAAQESWSSMAIAP